MLLTRFTSRNRGAAHRVQRQASLPLLNSTDPGATAAEGVYVSQFGLKGRE